MRFSASEAPQPRFQLIVWIWNGESCRARPVRCMRLSDRHDGGKGTLPGIDGRFG